MLHLHPGFHGCSDGELQPGSPAGTPAPVFYYRCQHRKKIDEEHFCDFKPSLNQDELNGEVVQIIRDMVVMEKFRDFIQDKLHEKVDVSALEAEREQMKGKLLQVTGAKKKLVLMLDKLDANDRHYDRKYQDMQEHLDNLYDRISELKEMLSDVEDEDIRVLQGADHRKTDLSISSGI